MTSRVVFLGSPEFAVPSLEALHNDERFDIVLVVSQPDRPAGRGRKLTPPPVAAFAHEHGLPLFQPESLRDDQALQQLESVSADVLVVVAYGEMLNRRALAAASHGALNVHPSLLPKYRGATPIPQAILNGDPETGVSIMRLVRRLDAGPVLAQQTVRIELDDTSGSLGDRLSTIAADMLPDVVSDWVDGRLDAVPQDDEQATYCNEWSKADAKIDWSRPAADIERLVRAAIPWPVAWTEADGSRLQVRQVRVSDLLLQAFETPGTLQVVDGHAVVTTGDGALELLVVQPASKRAMPAGDWLRSLRSTEIKFT